MTPRNGGNPTAKAGRGRLTARPGAAPTAPLTAGLHTLSAPGSREALLHVPRAADPAAAVPLVVSLHGAGGNARHGIDLLRAPAETHGFAVLAPASRQGTWDLIASDYGPDVTVLDALLARTFAQVYVRPEALAISGFSDGASYALSLGVANGDLFRHVIAFSPGFLSPPAQHGEPRLFVSHGTRDTVLPIERCSRVLVPRLRRTGYTIEYREFDGPHTIPEDIREAAVRWWLGPSA